MALGLHSKFSGEIGTTIVSMMAVEVIAIGMMAIVINILLLVLLPSALSISLPSFIKLI